MNTVIHRYGPRAQTGTCECIECLCSWAISIYYSIHSITYLSYTLCKCLCVNCGYLNLNHTMKVDYLILVNLSYEAILIQNTRLMKYNMRSSNAFQMDLYMVCRSVGQ